MTDAFRYTVHWYHKSNPDIFFDTYLPQTRVFLDSRQYFGGYLLLEHRKRDTPAASVLSFCSFHASLPQFQHQLVTDASGLVVVLMHVPCLSLRFSIVIRLLAYLLRAPKIA